MLTQSVEINPKAIALRTAADWPGLLEFCAPFIRKHATRLGLTQKHAMYEDAMSEAREAVRGVLRQWDPERGRLQTFIYKRMEGAIKNVLAKEAKSKTLDLDAACRVQNIAVAGADAVHADDEAQAEAIRAGSVSDFGKGDSYLLIRSDDSDVPAGSRPVRNPSERLTYGEGTNLRDEKTLEPWERAEEKARRDARIGLVRWWIIGKPQNMRASKAPRELWKYISGAGTKTYSGEFIYKVFAARFYKGWEPRAISARFDLTPGAIRTVLAYATSRVEEMTKLHTEAFGGSPFEVFAEFVRREANRRWRTQYSHLYEPKPALRPKAPHSGSSHVPRPVLTAASRRSRGSAGVPGYGGGVRTLDDYNRRKDR